MKVVYGALQIAFDYQCAEGLQAYCGIDQQRAQETRKVCPKGIKRGRTADNIVTSASHYPKTTALMYILNRDVSSYAHFVRGLNRQA